MRSRGNITLLCVHSLRDDLYLLFPWREHPLASDGMRSVLVEKKSQALVCATFALFVTILLPILYPSLALRPPPLSLYLPFRLPFMEYVRAPHTGHCSLWQTIIPSARWARGATLAFRKCVSIDFIFHKQIDIWTNVPHIFVAVPSRPMVRQSCQ